jgi:hypothetical protein
LYSPALAPLILQLCGENQIHMWHGIGVQSHQAKKK